MQTDSFFDYVLVDPSTLLKMTPAAYTNQLLFRCIHNQNVLFFYANAEAFWILRLRSG